MHCATKEVLNRLWMHGNGYCMAIVLDHTATSLTGNPAQCCNSRDHLWILKVGTWTTQCLLKWSSFCDSCMSLLFLVQQMKQSSHTLILTSIFPVWSRYLTTSSFPDWAARWSDVIPSCAWKNCTLHVKAKQKYTNPARGILDFCKQKFYRPLLCHPWTLYSM